jgi:hypothetical protein
MGSPDSICILITEVDHLDQGMQLDRRRVPGRSPLTRGRSSTGGGAWSITLDQGTEPTGGGCLGLVLFSVEYSLYSALVIVLTDDLDYY